MNSGTRLHLAVFPYDIPAVQAWLEDQAAKGEFLSEYTILPVFDRGEPKAVRYRLEPMIQKEKAPDQHRRELYEELGWQYVCTIRKSFHIWRCDDPETPELFTEAETEGGAYHFLLRMERRGFRIWAILLAYILALLAWTFCSGTSLLREVDHWTPWWSTLLGWAAVAAVVPAAVYTDWCLRRYIRALRIGVPQPHRRPYRGARALSTLVLAVWAVFFLSRVILLFQPSSRPFEPVENFGQPVPYVSLAELGDQPPCREAEALRIRNFAARESWWSSEGDFDQPPFVLTKYYRMWLPFQAERMATAWVEQSAEWEGQLEMLSHPALDGAWLFRFDGGVQLLLLRSGAQLLEFQYDGSLDLRQKLDVFADALERFGEVPQS